MDMMEGSKVSQRRGIIFAVFAFLVLAFGAL